MYSLRATYSFTAILLRPLWSLLTWEAEHHGHHGSIIRLSACLGLLLRPHVVLHHHLLLVGKLLLLHQNNLLIVGILLISRHIWHINLRHHLGHHLGHHSWHHHTRHHTWNHIWVCGNLWRSLRLSCLSRLFGFLLRLPWFLFFFVRDIFSCERVLRHVQQPQLFF